MNTTDVARAMGCHPGTVRRWINQGELPARLQPSEKPEYVVSPGDLQEFRRSRDDPKPRSKSWVREAIDAPNEWLIRELTEWSEYKESYGEDY